MSQFGLGKYGMNNKNPFIEKAIDEINDNIVKKYRNATGTDQRAILQAFDPKTGETLGHTTFVRQIEVDEDKFAKMYLSQFSAFFDLGTQGIRVFGYIMSKLVIGQDMFIFILSDVMEYTKYSSKSSIFIGLGQLLKAEIIARGPSDSLYYINPLVVFNGNRVTYAKTYVKKIKKLDINPNQMDIFDSQQIKPQLEQNN
jgi:intergrase/recombinase